VAFIIIITIIELGSLGRWMIHGFLPGIAYDDPSWYFAFTSNNLFHLLNTLSPFFVLLMVYSFILTPFKQIIIRYVRKIDLEVNFQTDLFKYMENWFAKLQTKKSYFLLILLILAAVIPYYPNLSTVNPDESLVGTDYFAYAERIRQVDAISPIESIFAKVSDRPVSIIIIYYFYLVVGDLSVLFEIIPSILSPITLFIVYKTVLQSTYNRNVALFAGFLVIVSHYIIVGIYGGFLANWIAIIFMLTIFYLLLRESKKPSYVHYVAIAALTAAAMFTHVYGWTYILAILIAYTIFTFISSRRTKNRKDASIALLIVLIGGNIIGDYAKLQVIGTSSGVESDVELAESAISSEQFSQRYGNLRYMLTTYFGGFLSNPVLFILAIVWTLNAKINRPFDRLLLSSIYVAAPVFVMSSYLLQSRLMYMMPLPIIGALITYELMRNRKPAYMLIFVMIVVFLTSNVLRSLGNMVFIAPPSA
jgi:hypothetical protein